VKSFFSRRTETSLTSRRWSEQSAKRERRVQTSLRLSLCRSHLPQVIGPGVENSVLQQLARTLDVGGSRRSRR